MAYERDIAAAQATLLANDFSLGQALHSLAKLANRSDLFAAIRAKDTAEVGRVFTNLLEGELRCEAVRLVCEAMDEEVAAQVAELRHAFADCPRPNPVCQTNEE